jgi:hypothetical protein
MGACISGLNIRDRQDSPATATLIISSFFHTAYSPLLFATDNETEPNRVPSACAVAFSSVTQVSIKPWHQSCVLLMVPSDFDRVSIPFIAFKCELLHKPPRAVVYIEVLLREVEISANVTLQSQAQQNNASGPSMTNKTILGFSDIEAAIYMRDWLQAACEKAGAKIVGGDVRREEADLDIELEGDQFAVSIKPLKGSI